MILLLLLGTGHGAGVPAACTGCDDWCTTDCPATCTGKVTLTLTLIFGPTLKNIYTSTKTTTFKKTNPPHKCSPIRCRYSPENQPLSGQRRTASGTSQVLLRLTLRSFFCTCMEQPLRWEKLKVSGHNSSPPTSVKNISSTLVGLQRPSRPPSPIRERRRCSRSTPSVSRLQATLPIYADVRHSDDSYFRSTTAAR